MSEYIERNEIISGLKNELSDLGFVFEPELPGHFIYKPNEDVLIWFALNLNTKTTKEWISSLYISFLKVENTLIRVGSLPSIDISYIKDRKVPRGTISFKDTIYNHLTGYNVVSIESLNIFIVNVKRYLVDYGLPFYEKYSSLQDVLGTMDDLHANGKLWNEIIEGGPDFLFKGLIISKLCRDKNFEGKKVYVKKLITEQLKDQRWIEAYDRMTVFLSEL